MLTNFVLLSHYILGHLKLLSLNPQYSDAAVTLENEALLFALFIVFATVIAHAFTTYCDQFTYLAFRVDFFQATKHACLQPPKEFIWIIAVSKIPASIQELNKPLKLIQHFCIGWLAEYWSGSCWTCQTYFCISICM